MEPPRRPASRAVRQRRPVLLADRRRRGRALLRAPGHNAGVHPPREPWRNGTIERFNDTFDKRFFRQERFTGRAQLAERAGAFERFHNAQHRYSATRGQTPDEAGGQATKRTPIALDQLPADWPERGRIEFIRFIRSDHKLRLLGRAIAMPDGHAYQYVTATLDLSIAKGTDNLLVCDEHGELITTTRLTGPRR